MIYHSRHLRHHTSKYPLSSDRSYYAFESGFVHQDLATSIQAMAQNETIPADVRKFFTDIHKMVSTGDFEEMKSVVELVRTRAFQSQSDPWNVTLLMLCVFLSEINPITPRMKT